MSSNDKTNKNDHIFVCRCEEVTEEEVRNVVRQGIATVDGVKRATRAGMGLCQSKTCFTNIARIIHQETGIPLKDLYPIKIRIPVRPVKVDTTIEDF
jgi:bacterioferritin-associated ferredoxin